MTVLVQHGYNSWYPENEFAFGIATDSEGNVYVTGETEGALMAT